jgi:hypothetical protein
LDVCNAHGELDDCDVYDVHDIHDIHRDSDARDIKKNLNEMMYGVCLQDPNKIQL